MGLTKSIVTLSLLARVSLAAWANPTPPSYCTAGCIAAMMPYNFDDRFGNETYCGDPWLVDTTPWHSTLRIDSIYLCTKFYCSEQEAIAGVDYLTLSCKVKGYGKECEGFQDNYNKVTDINTTALAAVPRISPAIPDGGVFGPQVLQNTTVIPSPLAFQQGYWTVARFFDSKIVNRNYSFAMFGFWGAALFIGIVYRLLSLLSMRRHYTPTIEAEGPASGMTGKSSLVKRLSYFLDAYIILPSTFPQRCHQPVGWCTLPPRLQSLTIFVFFIINMALCIPHYHMTVGNVHFPGFHLQFIEQLGDRFGILAFANLPLIWLFATRNNVFLWLTGWDFATFNSFHRWVARIATLEAFLHACCHTAANYIAGLDLAIYVEAMKAQYLYTGALATTAMVLLLGFSVYGLRRSFYEVFLLLHIGLALMALICCFLHVSISHGEYDDYLWPCVAIWVFDRVARIARIMVLNIKSRITGRQAKATYDAASQLIHLDVPVWLAAPPASGTYYYLYSPSILPGWQSHPFTLGNWQYLGDMSGTQTPQTPSEFSLDLDAEKTQTKTKTQTIALAASSDTSLHSGNGNGNEKQGAGTYVLSFVIRAYEGYTARFRDKIIAKCQKNGSDAANMAILAEGPYGIHTPLHSFSEVLLILGGSGITVGTSHLRDILASKATHQKIHIVWSAREEEFARSVSDELRSIIARTTQSSDVSVDLYVTKSYGETEMREEKGNIMIHSGRANIPALVEKDVLSGAGSMAVIVSGPGRMADECRASVVRCMKQTRREVKYLNETFGW